jgi:hypothetical protein
MYSYYAATYFGRIPNFIRALITSLQLLQMAVGVTATVLHLQCYPQQVSDMQYRNSVLALVMYTSYLLLFSKLFMEQYITKPSAKGAGKKSI